MHFIDWFKSAVLFLIVAPLLLIAGAIFKEYGKGRHDDMKDFISDCMDSMFAVLFVFLIFYGAHKLFVFVGL